jgi:hypothetical protein
MNKSSYAIDPNDLTVTAVEQFKAFMKFIGDNNLWDEVEKALLEQGIAEIAVSSKPIQSVRKLIQDKFLTRGELSKRSRTEGQLIARCTCGSGSPGGAGHGPVSPTGGGDAGAGDGGHPM